MKKLSFVFCTMLIVFGTFAPVSAIEELAEPETFVIDLPSGETNTEAGITPFSYMEHSRKLVETNYVTKKGVGWAGGQPSRGYVFGSEGSLCWVDGGPSVSVSLGGAYGAYSFSTSVGYVGNSTNSCVTNLAKNTPWKLYISKDFTVKKYLVTYSIYGATGTKYEYVSNPTRVYLDAKKV